MAQSLNKIRHRIQTIQSTRKITSAMKLVSNVKMMQLRRQLIGERAFLASLERFVGDVVFYNDMNSSKAVRSPLLEKNDKAQKTLYVIFMSDLGLCAGYNDETLILFKRIFKEGDEAVFIGEKTSMIEKRISLTHYDDFIDLYKDMDREKMRDLTDFLIEKYSSKQYSSVSIVYHEYVNTLTNVTKCYPLLPLSVKENKDLVYDPIYIPNKQGIADYLLPIYIRTLVENKIYETLVSENSARRNAMDSADQNANDMIANLKLNFNKERQQAITQEITEVVSGSLLKKGE